MDIQLTANHTDDTNILLLGSVLRELRHQHGGRAHAGPPEQEGAGKIPGSDAKVPPSLDRARHSPAAYDQIRPPGEHCNIKHNQLKEIPALIE